MKRPNPRPLAGRTVPPAQLARITAGIGGWGNDWLAGGTGQDARTTGGAGLDILIGNTGGDR